ncbi:copper resistance CopC family protein [Saccharopolyspora sp. NPDC002376]
MPKMRKISVRAGRVAAALAMAGACAVPTAGLAAADATLLSTDPADGAQVAELPAAATLQFNQPVNPKIITITVTGPAGENVAAAPPTVNETVVSQPLLPAVNSGTYTLAFRVVSDGGHPVAGKRTFTLAPAPGAAASQAPVVPSQQPQPPQAAPDEGATKRSC